MRFVALLKKLKHFTMKESRGGGADKIDQNCRMERSLFTEAMGCVVPGVCTYSPGAGCSLCLMQPTLCR